MTLISSIRINENERKVLRVLAESHGVFDCFPFCPLSKLTRLNSAKLRRAFRSLKRKSLAEFERGLWSEDGEPVGSGYRVTEAGVDFINQLSGRGAV